jgi:VanZ family protein
VNARRALLGLGALVLLLAFHLVTPPRGGLLLRTFYDATHVPLFAVLAVGILFATPREWTARKRNSVALGSVALIAVVSELLQIPTARDASVRDLVADLMGSTGALCLAAGLSGRFPYGRRRRLATIAIGIAALALPLLPLATVSAAYLHRAVVLPDLVRFDSRFSAFFCEVQNGLLTRQRDDLTGDVAATILLGEAQWPGIAFNDPWPHWEAYEAFVVEIENTGSQVLPVTVRVHDRAHNQDYSDCFNGRYELAPGRHRLSIDLDEIRAAPANRDMDLSAIDGVVIFATAREAGREFLLHAIRLEASGAE